MQSGDIFTTPGAMYFTNVLHEIPHRKLECFFALCRQRYETTKLPLNPKDIEQIKKALD